MAKIVVDLNVFDDEGNDVIDHASQLILVRRSGRRSSGDTDDILNELEEALVVSEVLEALEHES